MSIEEKQDFLTYQDSDSFEYPQNEKEVSTSIKKFYKSNLPIELLGSGSKSTKAIFCWENLMSSSPSIKIGEQKSVMHEVFLGLYDYEIFRLPN